MFHTRYLYEKGVCNMRKISLMVATIFLSIILAGCNNGETENQQSNNSENHSQSEENDTNNKSDNKISSSKDDNSKQTNKANGNESENRTNDSTENVTKNKNDKENGDESSKNQGNDTDDNSYLKGFSAKEVEYARVWHQLGPMKNSMKGMDGLYVTEIPRGTKVNPQAKNSAVYQEDVVKLEAPIKAGGSVTYSSNGDGSINVYKNIPYKWESPQMSDYRKMSEVTRKAIENNVKTVYIEPSDNKQVAELADKIKYSKR